MSATEGVNYVKCAHRQTQRQGTRLRRREYAKPAIDRGRTVLPILAAVQQQHQDRYLGRAPTALPRAYGSTARLRLYRATQARPCPGLSGPRWPAVPRGHRRTDTPRPEDQPASGSATAPSACPHSSVTSAGRCSKNSREAPPAHRCYRAEAGSPSPPGSRRRRNRARAAAPRGERTKAVRHPVAPDRVDHDVDCPLAHQVAHRCQPAVTGHRVVRAAPHRELPLRLIPATAIVRSPAPSQLEGRGPDASRRAVHEQRLGPPAPAPAGPARTGQSGS